MPSNKDFQRRIEIIDSCLRRRQRQWSMKDILYEVNNKLTENFGKSVSQRTLYADMNYLIREMDAPVEKYNSDSRVCYRYSDPDYSIKNLPIREDDLSLLRDAAELLSQVHGFAIAGDMLAVVNRLENTIATNIQGRNSIIQFEKNGLAAGTHWLQDCFEAVKGQCVLKIDYQPFGKEKITHLFHPYLLKEYRNRWFLIGRIDGYNQVTNLALDRILHLKPVRNTFMENNLFDPVTYFDDMVGVSLPENAKPEEIELKVTDALYPYIQTKPIHSSQKLISDKPGDKRVSLTVIDNHELRAHLLGLGPGVVVIKPAILREEMKRLWEDGVSQYNS